MNKCFALCCSGLVLLLAGCGGGPVDPPAAFVRTLSRQLPPGWRVDLASGVPDSVPVAVEPGDILIWKTDPVALRQRRDTDPAEGVLYFRLEARPWVEPDAAREVLREHREIQRQHVALDATVAHLSRTAQGEFLVRGWTEENELNAYREAKAALPPLVENFPGHYLPGHAYLLHDPRARLVPTAREHQTEMNVAYGVTLRNLETY